MTTAPQSLAAKTAERPTLPAAPETSTVWPGLTSAPTKNELAAGHGDERKSGRVNEVHACGNPGEKPGAHGAEFGVGVVGPGENLVSNGKPFYASPELFDRSREVPTQNARKPYRPPYFRFARAFKRVYWVHACRCDAHQDFARLQNRIRIVFVTKDLRSAILVNDRCFHGFASVLSGRPTINIFHNGDSD